MTFIAIIDYDMWSVFDASLKKKFNSNFSTIKIWYTQSWESNVYLGTSDKLGERTRADSRLNKFMSYLCADQRKKKKQIFFSLLSSGHFK